MIYLDWASTSPPNPELLAESASVAESHFGNPSSAHALGKAAREKLDEARDRLLSSLVNEKTLSPSLRGRIAFTGSGTEADSIVLLSLLRRSRTNASAPLHILASAIEHSAIYEELRLFEKLGIACSFVSARPDGLIDAESIAKAVKPETALVTIMAVNNETGAIQPLGELVRAVVDKAAALGKKTPFIHTDAVQALGKIEFDPYTAGVSSAAFSAHKIGGPRGVGALWLRESIAALSLGGGQEGGLRPGTENLPGAWAFARAAEYAKGSLEKRLARARMLEAQLLEGLLAIRALPLPLGRQAGDARYSPFIVSASFPGLSGEVLVRALSDGSEDGSERIAVSTGAACSTNGQAKGRRVLEAMGLDAKLAFSAIRISTGETTEAWDVEAFLKSVGKIYAHLKA